MDTNGKYEGLEIPDSIVPFVGVRAWRISETLRREKRLASVYKNGVYWPIKRRLEAKCIKPGPLWGYGWLRAAAATSGQQQGTNPLIPRSEKVPPHDQSPFDDCMCGIYAMKSPVDHETKEVTPWQNSCVVGIAFIYGRVLEGERGWRGQYGRIAALLYEESETKPPLEMYEMMSETYRVPLITDLAGEFERQRKLQGS